MPSKKAAPGYGVYPRVTASGKFSVLKLFWAGSAKGFL